MKSLNDYAPHYKCIVADPPWAPKQGAAWSTRFTDKARPQKHYPVMKLDEIKELVVPAMPQAHLWLWVINQHIDWGYEVARAWGFEPLQIITWAKPGLGCGQFQSNTEHCLVCRKGSRHDNPFGHTRGTWFSWPRGRHSEKPAEFYNLVEQVSPGPYLEMFARKKRHGWDAWGNEIDDSLAFLELPNSAMKQLPSSLPTPKQMPLGLD